MYPFYLRTLSQTCSLPQPHVLVTLGPSLNAAHSEPSFIKLFPGQLRNIGPRHLVLVSSCLVHSKMPANG